MALNWHDLDTCWVAFFPQGGPSVEAVRHSHHWTYRADGSDWAITDSITTTSTPEETFAEIERRVRAILVLRGATGMMTLAEQCEDRGMKIEDLIGKTIKEVCALGFQVENGSWPTKRDSFLLQRDLFPEEGVDTHNFGRKTGYVWVAPDWEPSKPTKPVDPSPGLTGQEP